VPINDSEDISDFPYDHEHHQYRQDSYPTVDGLVDRVHQPVLSSCDGEPCVAFALCHG